MQSDPEVDETDTGKTFGRTSRHLLDKRKNKSRGSARTEPGINNNMYAERSGFAPLQGSKSLGRLDGLKEVGNWFDECFNKLDSFHSCSTNRISVFSPYF